MKRFRRRYARDRGQKKKNTLEAEQRQTASNREGTGKLSRSKSSSHGTDKSFPAAKVRLGVGPVLKDVPSTGYLVNLLHPRG